MLSVEGFYDGECVRIKSHINFYKNQRVIVIFAGDGVDYGTNYKEPLNFHDWLIKKYDGVDSPEGDFAYDIKRDKDFPLVSDDEFILFYLRNKLVDKYVIQTFKKCRSKYRAYTREYRLEQLEQQEEACLKELIDDD